MCRGVACRPGRPGARLHPLRPSPLKLAEQHAAELLEANGRVVERGEDRLPLGDLEGEDLHVSSVRIFEAFGEVRVADESGELEHGFVSDGDAARCTRVTLRERVFLFNHLGSMTSLHLSRG